MPIYEYRCRGCGQVFEEWKKRADDEASHPCPSCEDVADRIMSNTTFALKGGGWYATDYGNRRPGVCTPKKDDPKTAPASAPSTPAASPCAGGSCPSGGCAAAD